MRTRIEEYNTQVSENGMKLVSFEHLLELVNALYVQTNNEARFLQASLLSLIDDEQKQEIELGHDVESDDTKVRTKVVHQCERAERSMVMNLEQNFDIYTRRKHIFIFVVFLLIKAGSIHRIN